MNCESCDEPKNSLTAAATGFALIMSCGLISSLSASVRRSLTARSTRTSPMRNATSAISPTQRTRRLPRWSMSSTLPSPFLIAISVRSTSTTSDMASPYLATIALPFSSLRCSDTVEK